MMPLIASLVCRETQLIVDRCRLELARLSEKHLESQKYIEAARNYLETARWTPPDQSEQPQVAPASPLPTVRNGNARLRKRAEETRFFAEMIRDVRAKREMMEIAERYDSLASAEAASAAPTIADNFSGLDAIAA